MNSKFLNICGDSIDFRVKRGDIDMDYKYDAETDILIIVMGKEKPDFAEQRENIIIHYNKSGLPIEIEIFINM